MNMKFFYWLKINSEVKKKINGNNNEEINF